MSTTMYSLSLSHGLWSLSWILEPFRSHQHPSESLSSLRTCQHAPADSLLRVSGVCTEEALLWNTISEVGGCPQYFRALSKGWCVRSHTSGLSQSERVPQQAHLRLKAPSRGCAWELEANVLLWPPWWGGHAWKHVIATIWNTSWKHQESKRPAAKRCFEA